MSPWLTFGEGGASLREEVSVTSLVQVNDDATRRSANGVKQRVVKHKQRQHVKAKTHFSLVAAVALLLPERQRDPATKALTKECAKCPACKDRLMDCHQNRARRDQRGREKKEEEKSR